MENRRAARGGPSKGTADDDHPNGSSHVGACDAQSVIRQGTAIQLTTPPLAQCRYLPGE